MGILSLIGEPESFEVSYYTRDVIRTRYSIGESQNTFVSVYGNLFERTSEFSDCNVSVCFSM